MAVELRQAMGGLLTLSMVIMLGNMIKRDHFGGDIVVEVPVTSTVQYDVFKVSRQSLLGATSVSKGWPWKEHEEALTPCWNMSLPKLRDLSRGFITFSLSGGPDYHIAQVSNAVIVARHLGATLVLPVITGSKPEETKNFWEIYDVEKFVASIGSVVKVVKNKPTELSTRKLVAIRVPNRVSKEFIAANVEPLFRVKGSLKIVTYFPSSNIKMAEDTKDVNPISCLAMFDALHLEPGWKNTMDSMVEKMKKMSSQSNGKFVAVDFRVETFGTKECRLNGVDGRKNCYNALEIGQFLKKVGFPGETAIFVTHSGWDSSLHDLKAAFPNTFTKDDLPEEEMLAKFLGSETSEYGKIVDFHICSISDVFVPSSPGVFFYSVAGRRIASRKTQILVPAQSPSASPNNYVSSFVSQRSHSAYSCFC